MIFRQIDEIISGKKTQTRRIVKPGECRILRGNGTYISHAVMTAKQQLKWWVFWDYAVQSGRGKPALWYRFEGDQIQIMDRALLPENVKLWHEIAEYPYMGSWRELRIRITAIRQERLQDISEADARAEGLKPIDGFGFMNEPPGPYDIITARDQYRDLWNSINKRKGTCWEDNPLVWVLEFERV